MESRTVEAGPTTVRSRKASREAAQINARSCRGGTEQDDPYRVDPSLTATPDGLTGAHSSHRYLTSSEFGQSAQVLNPSI